MKTPIKVKDLVRVVGSGGKPSAQRYQVEKVAGFYCEITQWPATNPRREPFDTSLLVVDNSGPALLAARFRR